MPDNDLPISPPSPIVHDDGSVEYPTDPSFVPVIIPEQDLAPQHEED